MRCAAAPPPRCYSPCVEESDGKLTARIVQLFERLEKIGGPLFGDGDGVACCSPCDEDQEREGDKLLLGIAHGCLLLPLVLLAAATAPFRRQTEWDKRQSARMEAWRDGLIRRGRWK